MNSESTANIWPTACAGGRRKSSRASSAGAARGTFLGWAVDVGREAFTEIDRVIAEHSSPDGSVTLAKLLAAPERERLACLDRLQALEEMQLAAKESAGVWRLADGWERFLVQRGEDLDAAAGFGPWSAKRPLDIRSSAPKIPFRSRTAWSWEWVFMTS